MKTKWKSILTNFAFLFVAYVAFMRIVFGQFDAGTIFAGIFTGLFSALFFPTLFLRMMRKFGEALVRTVPDLELKPEEILVRKAPANHMKGREGVGGVLFLTTNRLVFRSHKFNIQNHQEEFPINEIKALFAHPRWAKGLTVELTNNENHTFVLESPSDWISALTPQYI